MAKFDCVVVSYVVPSAWQKTEGRRQRTKGRGTRYLMLDTRYLMLVA